MKFRIIYSISALLLFGFLFQSNSGGRAAAGDGSTMAPGDGVFCSSCHGGGNYNPQVNVTLFDPLTEEATTEYVPGQTYKVVVNITASNNPPGYGFQAVTLKDSDNTAINNWVSAITPNTNFRTISNGRQYFEHTRRLTTNEFEAEWMAPEENTGDVTFYLAGNAVNANGSTSGDSPVANSVTFSEKMSTSSTSFQSEISMRLYPNPAFNDVSIQLKTVSAQVFNIRVLDINGKVWITKTINSWFGETIERLDLINLPAGSYMVHLSDGHGEITKKLLKL